MQLSRRTTDASPTLVSRGVSSIGRTPAPSRRDRGTRRISNAMDELDADLVDIPGVGSLDRRQLRRLQDTINGRATSFDITDLPDLTSMSRYQLRVLESALDDLP